MSTLTVKIYAKEEEAVKNCVQKLKHFAERFNRMFKKDLPLKEVIFEPETQEGIEKSRFIYHTGNETSDREVIVFLQAITTPQSLIKDIKRSFKRHQKQAAVLEQEENIVGNTAENFR